MPLLLLSLDNTLLDRAGPFSGWARHFLGDGAPPDDIDWLLSVDADGLAAVGRRRRLTGPLRAACASLDMVEELRAGVVERLDWIH